MAGPTPPRRRLPTTVVRARVDETRRRLEAQRPRNRVIDLLFGSTQLEVETGGGLLAGAIAFRFFLFLVPSVFVVVVGLGVGADLAHANIRDVAREAGIAGVAATAIQSSADASTVTRWVTFLVAVFALVVGARNLLKALWVAHALIWKLPLRRVPRPTMSGLGLTAVLAVAVVLLRLVNAIRDVSFAAWVVGLVVYTAVPAAVWLVCSHRLLPAPPGVRWQDLVPGALVFAVGAQGLHLFTVLWVTRSVEAKSQTYGAIGTALTILLWAYLLGRLVTAAAALNATVWRRTRSGVTGDRAPEQRAPDAPATRP